MIYMVSHEKFLMHMIDYFTRDELSYLEYRVISAGMVSGNNVLSVVSANALFPSFENQNLWIETNNRDALKKGFYEDLDLEYNTLYHSVIEPFAEHMDVVLITTEQEFVYLEILAEYLLERYKLPIINLNQLFGQGEIDPMKWNPKRIMDGIRRIQRKIKEANQDSMSSTPSGRLTLMNHMDRKERIKKLIQIGVDVDAHESDEVIQELLMEAWVKDDE
nr:MAG TPA: hypothetical protein [Caudoviricetes sp.]